jgi:hypothetical protein
MSIHSTVMTMNEKDDSSENVNKPKLLTKRNSFLSIVIKVNLSYKWTFDLTITDVDYNLN